MLKTNKDIVREFGDTYSRVVPIMLRNQHSFLIKTLDDYFKYKTSGNLVVVGPGGQVLPYSRSYTKDGKLGTTNREKIKNLLGNGILLLVDYVAEKEENGLEKSREVLNGLGFFDDGFFRNKYIILGCGNKEFDGIPWNVIDDHVGSPEIRFLKNNLRERLYIRDNKADVIDANLSVHHASITKNELERIYKEFYRILKPRGLLHLGEGEVDMNYSEEKIIKIGQDLSSLIDSDVLIKDERDKNYHTRYLFKRGYHYDRLNNEENSSSDNCFEISIDEKSLVYIPNGHTAISNKLKERGYQQMITYGEILVLPLIDPKISEDIEFHIGPTNRYYDRVIESVRKGYKGVDDQLIEDMRKAVNTEREYAKKGIVEFYMGENKILETLEKVGFKNIQVTHHNDDPFYNITAKKGKK